MAFILGLGAFISVYLSPVLPPRSESVMSVVRPCQNCATRNSSTPAKSVWTGGRLAGSVPSSEASNGRRILIRAHFHMDEFTYGLQRVYV